MSNSIINLNIPGKIKHDLNIVVNALLEKFGEDICKIILFGSYATGKYQPDSDIDVAVVLTRLPDIRKRRRYMRALDEDEVEADLLFCTKEQLLSNSFVYKRINEQGVVLYECGGVLN